MPIDIIDSDIKSLIESLTVDSIDNAQIGCWQVTCEAILREHLAQEIVTKEYCYFYEGMCSNSEYEHNRDTFAERGVQLLDFHSALGQNLAGWKLYLLE